MQLSYVLDAWMTHYKVSVRTLAKQIGVDYTVLHRFRHHENISDETLSRILIWLLNRKSSL